MKSVEPKEEKPIQGKAECNPSPGSVFAVQAGEYDGERQWYTGEFDRSHPPCGYVDGWSCAALWTVRDDADTYAKEFGGTVVEFRLLEVLPNAI